MPCSRVSARAWRLCSGLPVSGRGVEKSWPAGPVTKVKLVRGPSWSAGLATSQRPAKKRTRSRSSLGSKEISQRRFGSPFFQPGGSSYSMKLEKGISARQRS